MKRFLLVIAALWLSAGAAYGSIGETEIKGTQNLSVDTVKHDIDFARLRIPFIKNDSLVKDEKVKFLARTFAGTVFITDDGITYSIPRGNAEYPGLAIRERLVNARISPVTGIKPSATEVNYFKGRNKDDWKTKIPTYEEVGFGEVYDKIHLNIKAYSKNVEKLFTVDKGGDPRSIALQVEGANGLKVNDKGELEIGSEAGTVRMTKPVAYQTIGGKRVEVSVGYDIRNAGLKQVAAVYGFKVGEYDRSYPVVIDPLLASTYIGGSHKDQPLAIALAKDGSGDIYITGWTSSVDFPSTSDSYNPIHEPESYGIGIAGCDLDVFVSKFSSDLKTLRASTFIGGTYRGGNSGSCNEEVGRAISIDSSGNVYVAGYTDALDFPTTSGAYRPNYGGRENGLNSDGFISKFNGTLSTLVASTYFGSWGGEYNTAMALDSQDNVYVAGNGGVNGLFPAGIGYDTAYSYGQGYVAKLNANLTTLIAGTFLGGYQSLSSIALDSSGNVFVTGYTSATDFPVTAGAYSSTYKGGDDAFIAKFDSGLMNLHACTYIGGSHTDNANAIAIDSADNIYIAGYTYYNYGVNDFPTTTGAFKTSFPSRSGWDGFISKFDNNLTTLFASTYLGSNSHEAISSLVLDSAGNVYVAGYTASTDFPTTADADDTALNDGNYHYDTYDAFVAKLDPRLGSLQYSTYLGGTANDYGNAIAIDSAGKIIVAGYTTSTDFPATTDAFDTTFNSSSNIFADAFVTKMEVPRTLSVDVIGPTIVNPGQEITYLLKYKNGMDANALDVILKVNIPEKARYVSSTDDGIYLSDKGEVFWKLGTVAPDAVGMVTVNMSIPWGTPNSEMPVTAQIDASNSGFTTIANIQDYINYQPIVIVTDRLLSAAEIASLLATDGSFKRLYDYAVSKGFSDYGVARYTQTDSGDTITHLILLKPEPLEAMLVRKTNSTYILVRQTATNILEYLDGTGGLIMDLNSGVSNVWGTWADDATFPLSVVAGIPLVPNYFLGVSNAASACNGRKCYRNCVATNAVWAGIDALKETVIGVVKLPLAGLKSGYYFLKYAWYGDADSGFKVADTLAKELPYSTTIRQVIKIAKCGKDCTDNPSSNCCTGPVVVCNGTMDNWITHKACNTVTNTWGLFGSYTRCAEGLVCNDANPTIDGCLPPCPPGAPAKTCVTKKSRVAPAHDPNAKSIDFKGDVLAGQTLTYTIEYENTGAGTAYGVFIFDEISANLENISTQDNRCSYSAGLLSCVIGTLPPCDVNNPNICKGSVSFSVNVKTGLPAGTEIINYAEVHFPSADEITPTNPVLNIVSNLAADPKSAATTSGTPVAVTLSGRPATISYRITSDPQQGTLTGTVPNVTYTPADQFSGQDEFYYVVNDGSIDSYPAKVTVTVNPNLGEQTKPTVDSTYPESGAANIHPGSTPVSTNPDQYSPTIMATFSEPIDSSTLTGTSFLVDGKSGSVFYDEETRTASFAPSTALANAATYTARITTAVKDKAGNSLASEYSWQFTTESAINMLVTLPLPDTTTLNFGNLLPGQTSTDKIATVSSTGTQNLIIGAVSLTGADTGSFTIKTDNCSGKTLAPGQDCTVSLAFKSLTLGAKNATLVIPSNDPDANPKNLPLSGTGVAASPTEFPVQRVSGQTTSSYIDLQSAYNAVTAAAGDIIEAITMSFSNGLTCGKDKSVTLQGGYNPGFGSRSGTTTIQGKMTVTKGTVTVDKIEVK